MALKARAVKFDECFEYLTSSKSPICDPQLIDTLPDQFKESETAFSQYKSTFKQNIQHLIHSMQGTDYDCDVRAVLGLMEREIKGQPNTLLKEYPEKRSDIMNAAALQVLLIGRNRMMSGEFAKLEEERGELENKVVVLRATREQVQRDIEEMSANHSKHEKATIDCKEEFSKLEASFEQLKEDAKKQALENDEAKKSGIEYRLKTAELEKELKCVQKLLGNACQEAKQAEGDCLAKAKDYKELCEKHNKEKEELRSVEEKRNKLEGEKTRIKAEHEAAKSEWKKLKKTVKSKNEELKAVLEKIEEEKKKLVIETADKSKENEGLIYEIASNKKKLAVICSELAAKEKEKNELDEKFTEKQKDYNALETRYKPVKEDLIKDEVQYKNLLKQFEGKQRDMFNLFSGWTGDRDKYKKDVNNLKDCCEEQIAQAEAEESAAARRGFNPTIIFNFAGNEGGKEESAVHIAKHVDASTLGEFKKALEEGNVGQMQKVFTNTKPSCVEFNNLFVDPDSMLKAVKAVFASGE